MQAPTPQAASRPFRFRASGATQRALARGARWGLGALLALAVSPASGQSRVGTTAGAFLEVGTGARNVALGEAGVATAEGATALYWNPAGIARTPGGEVSLQHTEWIAGTRLEYAGAVISAGAGRVGVHAYLFESGEMDVTTLEFEDGTGEQFEVQDLSFGLSYARQLTDRFDIGGTVKYVGTRLFRTTAAAVAADVGIRYQTPFEGVTLGFGIFNFGTEMRLAGDNLTRRVDFDPGTAGDNDAVLATLSTQSWDLPMLFRIGATYDAYSSDAVDVRISTDAYFPNNNNQYLNAGAEITLMDTVHLRGGMANLLLDDTFGQGSLRLGAGVELGGAIRADYAFANRGDLGNVSTLGASFSF